MNEIWQAALNFSLEKIRNSIPLLEDFPVRCEGPTWILVNQKRLSSNWVDGFWVGQLWLAYAYTKNPLFEAAAREWTDRVAWLKTTTGTHDLGFIFYLSNVLGAYATEDKSLFENALIAAETCTKRWKPRGE